MGGDPVGTASDVRQGHPAQPLSPAERSLPEFVEELGMKPVAPQIRDALLPCTIQLPSTVHVPLPSPQLVKYWSEAVHVAQTTLQSWDV